MNIRLWLSPPVALAQRPTEPHSHLLLPRLPVCIISSVQLTLQLLRLVYVLLDVLHPCFVLATLTVDLVVKQLDLRQGRNGCPLALKIMCIHIFEPIPIRMLLFARAR